MIVTTAITAVTPTTIPVNVNAVRSLFARRLASATLNASHVAVRRKRGNEVLLPNSFVLLDQSVTNRNNAVGAGRDVVLVGNDDDRVAFGVQPFEEVHDLHAGV